MTLSTLKLMNDAMDASSVEPAMIRGARIQWPGGPEMAQNFSLPLSIIYYIAMNPENPEVYNKLIQTCKYFFQRNPILVAAVMTENGICSNDECYGNGKCCVKIDINKMTSKIWLTRRLRLYQNSIPNFTALLRPKIYRCDIVKLLIFYGTVNFDDFKFFTSSVKEIGLVGTKIVDNNGKPMTLENILEVLPNVEKFTLFIKESTSMVSAATAKNISKLKNLGKLKELSFHNIPEVFKVDDLDAFSKDHNGIKFRLVFANGFSEHYVNQLNHLTDLLIESERSNCFIIYRGQNREKRGILWDRFCK